MIIGSTKWTTGLNVQNPRPLYIFAIPGLSLTLSSFINQVLPDPAGAVANITDLATAGAGAVIVTSATGGFQPWMVGYWLPIASGTNFSAGNYTITGWNSSNSVMVGVSPTPGGAGSAGVGKVTLAINADSFLPIIKLTTGGSQKLDELTGHSSISQMTIQAVDNSGALKTLAANTAAIGQVCTFSMGFPGCDASNTADFVPIEVKTIAGINRTQDGWMTFTLNDLMMNMVNDIFMNGGPGAYYQFTAAAKLSLTSSNVADTTRTVVITGFDGSGNALNETVTLNGTTEVLSTNTYTLIQSILANVALQIAIVTLKQGSGGVTIGTIPRGSISGTGSAVPTFPVAFPALLDNGLPISTTNPRYLSGNPLDILLAVMQNEIGVGQATPPVLVVNTGGGSGTGQAGYGISPLWTLYDGTVGLINPNTYMDVPGVIALRDGEFSGDRMEFVLTSSQTGKSWVEQEILKPLGLVWIMKSNGQLALKSMKHPAVPTTAVITDSQIIGIPKADRWPIINMVQCSVPSSEGSGNNMVPIPFANQSSLSTYKSRFLTTITSNGLRLGYGGFQKLFLLVNRIFNRHAYGTPTYTFEAFLNQFVMELGEFFTLTHPLLIDYVAGVLGVTSVLCEIVDRQPNYSTGRVTFTIIDTRFIKTSNGAFQISAVGDAIPVYGSASAPQRALYMFVSDNTGHYSTGAVANQLQ